MNEVFMKIVTRFLIDFGKILMFQLFELSFNFQTAANLELLLIIPQYFTFHNFLINSVIKAF